MAETPYLREPGYAERYRDARFVTAHGPRTDQRERAAIRRLLARARELGAVGPVRPVGAVGHDGAADAVPWLDVPSGAGRLSGELPGRTVLVDRDPAMLRACAPDLARAAAAATALPFADGTFAGALCCRLLQHIPGADERVRILAELRRVCRGPAIVSFFDSRSLLAARRRLRRVLGKPRSGRGAVSRRAFADEARAAGWRPVAFAALQRFVAEQSFALLLAGDDGRAP